MNEKCGLLEELKKEMSDKFELWTELCEELE